MGPSARAATKGQIADTQPGLPVQTDNFKINNRILTLASCQREGPGISETVCLWQKSAKKALPFFASISENIE